MKIVEFTAYYYPEMFSSRHLDDNLNEDIINCKHSIDIFTPTPCRGIDSITRNKFKKIRNESLFGGAIKIHRFPLFKEGKNILIRACRYIIMNIIHIYFGLSVKADVIYICSTPPTQGLIGVIIKKIRKIPFIYDLQDIFPDSMINAKLVSSGSLAYKVGRKMENVIYKNASIIRVLSENFKENLISKGVPKDKIKVVYNWIDEKEVISIDRGKNIVLKKYNLDASKFFVVYAGNLGNAQNIDLIIESAYILKDYLDIEFIIFGSEDESENYKNLVIREKLYNVKIFPLQEYNLVSHVYSLGDCCVVSCKRGYGSSAMPSKTWSIMATCTPVLASFDENTELQEIIEKNRLGLFSKSDDVKTFSNNILKLYNDLELKNELGVNARKFIIENLTRKESTKKIINLIESVGELDV